MKKVECYLCGCGNMIEFLGKINFILFGINKKHYYVCNQCVEDNFDSTLNKALKGKVSNSRCLYCRNNPPIDFSNSTFIDIFYEFGIPVGVNGGIGLGSNVCRVSVCNICFKENIGIA